MPSAALPAVAFAVSFVADNDLEEVYSADVVVVVVDAFSYQKCSAFVEKACASLFEEQKRLE